MNETTSNATNGTSGAPSTSLTEPIGITILRLTIEVAFALFGVIGNILVCVVIATRRNMKTVMNYYLVSLAAADLGILVILFPITIIIEHLGTAVLGRAYCLYAGPILEIFIGASIGSITVIALERYYNVGSTRRAFPRGGHIPKRVYLIILAVWILSFLLISLPLFFIYSYGENGCILDDQQSFKIYSVYNGIATYVLPLTVICFTYGRLLLKIRKSDKLHDQMLSQRTQQQQEDTTQYHGNHSSNREKRRGTVLERNNKIKRILTPLVILFAVTMSPITTLRCLNAFWDGHHRYGGILFNVAVFFFILNSAMNPLIYFLVSQEFRAGFRHVWDRVSFRASTIVRTASSLLSRSQSSRNLRKTIM